MSTQFTFQGNSENRQEKSHRNMDDETSHTAQCHPGKGDATADALVSQGHFSKDSHLEPNCQKQADIRGRPFQDMWTEHAVKRALTQKKPDKCTIWKQPVKGSMSRSLIQEEARDNTGVMSGTAGGSSTLTSQLFYSVLVVRPVLGNVLKNPEWF